MAENAAASRSALRLDRALFWLRWLLLGGVALLVIVGEASRVPDDGRFAYERWLLVLLAGAAANLLLGGLAYGAPLPAPVGGALNLLLDGALAALFLWAAEGGDQPWLMLALLAVFGAAFRWGWRGLALGMVVLIAASGLVWTQLGDAQRPGALDAAGSLALALVAGALGDLLRGSGREPRDRAEHDLEVKRLRAARERTRAIYEMANTLGATLDYRRVLDTAQNIGTLVLRDELGPRCQLLSAALLFQGQDNLLRVISSRGLSRRDETVALPGEEGLLGAALQRAQPVFADDAAQDPELVQFAAAGRMKSVLAMPLRAGYDVYGVMLFGCDRPRAFSEDHVEIMTAIGTQATLALQNAVLYQNLLNEKERIVEVEEDARKKLARDLHDGPTQSVAAIAMRVNYSRRLLERQPELAVEELWKVEDLARRTTREIRHMLFTLRPLVLENQGLGAALIQLAEKMAETHHTRVEVEVQADVEGALDRHAQGVVFYVVEEAVNNARKHARCETIWVRLARRKAAVVVTIKDDGVGFDVADVDAGYDDRGSLGLVTMRERAELIEGVLQIESAQGQGTTITLTIPFASGRRTTSKDEPLQPLYLQARRAPPGDEPVSPNDSPDGARSPNPAPSLTGRERREARHPLPRPQSPPLDT